MNSTEREQYRRIERELHTQIMNGVMVIMTLALSFLAVAIVAAVHGSWLPAGCCFLIAALGFFFAWTSGEDVRRRETGDE